jgi:membrane protein DedA with SNARE-associated domain
MLSWLSPHDLKALISVYGYGAVGVIVGLESMGLPLPGETVLVIAALYAGTHPDLSIWGVVAAAATGAILGDNVGFWLGREFGYRLVLRYGRYVGLSEARIKLGQYLFQRHGGKVVFFGAGRRVGAISNRDRHITADKSVVNRRRLDVMGNR